MSKKVSRDNWKKVDPHLAESLGDALVYAFRFLEGREAIVFFLRSGLLGEIFTYKEIGIIFNMTGSNVMQIEAKARRKIRHPAIATPALKGAKLNLRDINEFRKWLIYSWLGTGGISRPMIRGIIKEARKIKFKRRIKCR